jgi:hypothetical protein
MQTTLAIAIVGLTAWGVTMYGVVSYIAPRLYVLTTVLP